MKARDELDVASLLGSVLDQLGVAHYLGGSMASSIHGEPRSTNDLDVIAALTLDAAKVLPTALGADFEIDEPDIRHAIAERRATHIYYLPFFLKVDLYVGQDSAFARSQLARRTRVMPREGVGIWVASAEDTVLQKLLWYRQGGEVMSSQWRDVLGVLRLAPSLDQEYLRRWVGPLGIDDLLSLACEEAGPIFPLT